MKRRSLNNDEKELWRRVTKDVAPMPKKSLLAEPEGPVARTDAQSAPLPIVGAPSLRPRAPHSQSSRITAPRGSRKLPDAIGAGDPGRDRRVGGKNLPIDRVLDLHGLTQGRAHEVFRRFIAQARADGCMCILVITGKGGPASSSSMTARRNGGDASANSGQKRSGGVLRARLSDWANEPDLRPLISRVAKARPKHGGDGAFYIFLKSTSQTQKR